VRPCLSRTKPTGRRSFAAAYLPAHYDAARRWPLVLALHGYGLDTRRMWACGVVSIKRHGRVPSGATYLCRAAWAWQRRIYGNGEQVSCAGLEDGQAALPESMTGHACIC